MVIRVTKLRLKPPSAECRDARRTFVTRRPRSGRKLRQLLKPTTCLIRLDIGFRRCLLATVLLVLTAAPLRALGVQPEPAATAAQTPTDKPKKADKKDAQAQPPKAKKAKKAKKPKSDVPAPDEPVNPEEAEGGKGARVSWKQHPSLRFGSVFRMDFEAKFQEDARESYPDASGLKDPVTGERKTFELHRNRVGLAGHLFKKIEYEVERELTETELTEKELSAGQAPKSPWKDVNVNLTFIKNAQVQLGRFKIPFGLDQLTGVTHNDFIYRSLGASYLSPARDTGGMVHGRFFQHGLNYWAGVFRHDGDNARSKKIQGGDETVAARVTGTPLRRMNPKAFTNLEIGSAYAVTSLSADSFRPNGLRGRTLLTQDTFFEPVYVNGRRYRWEGDADWTFGAGSARAEYTMVLDNRRKQGLGDEDLPDARYRAWYVSGSWVLTGEDKKRPVKPANDFLQGGVGAIEVVARFERMWFDGLGSGQGYRSPRAEFLLPEGEKAFTIGVNWTLNRFIKLQINGIREDVDRERNPVLPANFPAGAFWNRVLRLQFVL
jgi:phosphate-selective porin OprO and OprP